MIDTQKSRKPDACFIYDELSTKRNNGLTAKEKDKGSSVFDIISMGRKKEARRIYRDSLITTL